MIGNPSEKTHYSPKCWVDGDLRGLPSLKPTYPLNIGWNPKGKDHPPTIHFQGRTVSFREGITLGNLISFRPFIVGYKLGLVKKPWRYLYPSLSGAKKVYLGYISVCSHIELLFVYVLRFNLLVWCLEQVPKIVPHIVVKMVVYHGTK